MRATQDRRSKTRIEARPDLGWKVVFHHDEVRVELAIVDIAESGLRLVTREPLSAWQKSKLLELQQATLWKADYAAHRLALTVIACREARESKGASTGIDTETGTWVHCHCPDRSSQNILWQILLENRHPELGRRGADTLALGPDDRIPERGIYTEAARVNRLSFIENKIGSSLETIRKSALDAHQLVGNIENHIGSVEVPIGLVGPLLFNGQHARGEIYAPFATSEGALVASASRGALLLSLAGGVKTRTINQRMTRVPMFVMDSLGSAVVFSEWLKDHITGLQEAVAQVSTHAALTSIDITLSGRSIHASFVYATADAAGQNMTTAATWHACQWALAEASKLSDITVEKFVIDSGLSGDKKVNFKSYLEGRGTRVIAEAFIPGDILEKVMKVSPDTLAGYFNSGMVALAQAGAIGANINVSNAVAAMFVATGQDIACVHESSLANFYVERTDDGIYTSMHLPTLIVGTVGGGTSLPSQSECLKIMDCLGSDKAARFAEIIAGYCLALDLSTSSALVGGTFVRAHERLGRNRPVKWLTSQDLDRNLIQQVVQNHNQDQYRDMIIADVRPGDPVDTGDAIISELAARNAKKLIGILPYELTCHDTAGAAHKLEVVVKSKATDKEVILIASKMAGMCNATLGRIYDDFRYRSESHLCHLKELAIYGQSDSRFKDHTPQVFGIHQDDRREAYLVIMERLQNLQLMGTVARPYAWREEHIEAAISGLAALHSVWLGREAALMQTPWIGHTASAADMTERRALFREMLQHGHVEFPRLMTSDRLTCNLDLLNNVDRWWDEIERMPRTLIHNDFNPRNIGLREDQGKFRLCAFDWELATLHLPQRDLAEFLAFVTTEETTPQQIEAFVELHRTKLEEYSGTTLPRPAWRRGYELSLFDFGINRLAYYVMAHTFRQYEFLEHLVTNHQRLMDLAAAGQKRVAVETMAGRLTW
ncbi:MAG: 3-hydroxyacyl-ACP dehydratase [Deltaproteobacteria bacterium]|nr:3-hydroxyacyl-ACP dehydratase [Deltaproteobacteria bacterium]